jgi:hypothetical protein
MAENTDLSLANATVYLDLFGRVLVSWLWIKQGLGAARGLAKRSFMKLITTSIKESCRLRATVFSGSYRKLGRRQIYYAVLMTCRTP